MRLTITAVLAAGVMAVVPGIRGAEATRSKALTADEVIQLWSPRLKNHVDFGQMGGSPEQAPNVAAYSFRVVGPTFEELWNHYAELCGMEKRCAEKMLVINTGTGPNGSYIVSERASADGKGSRVASVFLLETDTYIVTVTFHAEPDGKSISGSLTAVVP